MSLRAGRRIGPYEVLGPLGAGAMGEVYRAHDPRLGRDVALKTLPSALVADVDRAARFEREARTLAQLGHPNIATLHGLERDGDVVALVMELVEGQTLEQRLRQARAKGGMPAVEVVSIARQLVAALDAAHEKGVVHRDLKPANIKLTPEGDVKVLDFGLAKSLAPRIAADDPQATRELAAAMTEAGTLLGTPAYMSPEQARGLAVDRRSDIWSFGAVLYEMMAGRPAFSGGTVSDVLAAVLGADVDFDALPPAMPPRVLQLVEHCLQRDTRTRLRDIADANAYLDVTQPATTSSEYGPGRRGGLSRRSLLLGAGAAIAGASLGATGSWLLSAGALPIEMPTYQRLTFRRGLVRTARFGPDFRTVFYGALWDGDVSRVYGVRPESPESAALPLPPGAPLAVSSKGELALALGSHLRGIMTYGTLARVPLAGGAPRELQERVKYADWSPDGSELAIVRDKDGRDLLEFPLGTVIAGADGDGRGFSFARISPRGDAVAAFELEHPDSLVGRAVILDRAGRMLAASEKYFNVFGLVWRGAELWFSAADQLPLFRNTVYALATTGAVRIVTRVPGNTTLHDIAPDGRVLLARTDDRSGIAVRLAEDVRERDLSWLDAPFLADISPDGRQVLFTEFGVGGGPDGSVYLRSTDGSPAVRLGEGSARALSPDGRWAAVRPTAQSMHLDLVPTGAGSVQRLERPGLQLRDARWLPDGEHMLVRAMPPEGTARLYLLDVSGARTLEVTPATLGVGYRRWMLSPDGTEVAVATTEGTMRYSLIGAGAKVIPGMTARWQMIGWIWGGLLVSENPEAGGRVWCMHVETGEMTPWGDFAPQDPAGIMGMDLNTLVTTPDGRSYGYNWHRALSDLYLVDGWR